MPPKVARLQSSIEYVLLAQSAAMRGEDPVAAKKCARILARKKREMVREMEERDGE